MIGLGGVTVQAGSMDQKDIDKIREFIARCQWTFAKTMPWAPHEYIVRGKCPLSEDEFLFWRLRTLGKVLPSIPLHRWL